MDIQKKKNAFRSQIRTKQIENLFKQRRKQAQRNNEMASDLSNQNMMSLIADLPHSIESIVKLLTNHPSQTTTILFNYLPAIMSTFCETTVVQWSNYMYIIEAMLIAEPQQSELRIQLIKSSSGPIIHKSYKLWESNKIIMEDIMRTYFDYLITLGSDVKYLTSVDVIMITNSLRQAFIQFYDCDSEESRFELFSSMILVCNNFVSVSSIGQIDEEYEIEQMKELFVNGLLQNPAVLKNVIMIGIATELMAEQQQILRFLINLTFVMSDPAQIHIFLEALLNLILCILGQHKQIDSTISVLTLRLINNIVVFDIHCASYFYKEKIIGKIIEIYGTNKASDESVLKQFVGTISTCIILVHMQEQILEYLFAKNIPSILFESLELLRTDNQLLFKMLDSLIVLANHNHEGIARFIPVFAPILQAIVSNNENQDICNLSESLLKCLE